MATLEYRYSEPVIQPGYVFVYRDGALWANVYAQYASVACYHEEHPQVVVDGVYQSDCPEIVEAGRDALVAGARAVMREHHEAERRREDERITRDLAEMERRPTPALPADVQRLFERYGGMRAIIEDDLPSDRADEAEDSVAAQRLREYDL